MNKNLKIFGVVFILLVIVVFLVSKQSNSTLNYKEKNFAIEDTATVTKIFLADKQDRQLTLERQNGSEWVINDSIEAIPEKIETLLLTVKNLKVQRPVSDAAHNNVISRLAARSVKVEIYQKAHRINLFNRIKLLPFEKNTRTYYMGGETQDKLGTFVLMEGAERPYVVGIPGFRGFVSTRFTARLGDWRHHKIFNHRISNIESLSLLYRDEPENSFRIETTGNQEFKLYSPQQDQYISDFDTVKVIEYLTNFRNLRYESYLSEGMQQTKIDSILAQEPVHIIKLKAKDRQDQTVKTHYMPAYGKTDLEGNPLDYNPETMFASINDGKDFVTIQFFAFDKVFKPIGYFTGDYEESDYYRFKGVL
ncbi:MAG: DUF4340 domain-containing protein [Bacteroidota bacterium]